GGKKEGLLPVRAAIWLLPAQLPGSGKRGCKQDRSQVCERCAHGKVAEECRRAEEREEDRNKERLGARGIELTFLGTRGEIKIRSRRHFRHSALLVRQDEARVMIDCGADLVKPAQGGGSYGHCVNPGACRPRRWARAWRRLSGPRCRRDLVA